MRRLRVLPHPAENGTAELTPVSDRRIREASPGAARFCIHETRAVSSPDDSGLLLDMFDDGVAWLVARGQPEQWGTEPFSQRPEGCKRAQDLAASGGLWIAEIGEEPVGALVVGEAPEYAPAIDRPELYIELLLTRRRHAGQGLGTRLIEIAIREARAAGREVVRVDCWAGAPGLVSWYRRHGFTPTDRYERRGFTGQIFSMSVA
jgi:GNAT superfamily N-acetyltransferase